MVHIRLLDEFFNDHGVMGFLHGGRGWYLERSEKRFFFFFVLD
jgi:hypothetical protein